MIALDVGDVRIGVAVSDPTGVIAQPLEVYKRVGFGPDSRYVLGLCERFDTRDVLLGLPLNMDGTRGGQAEKAMAFGQVLERAGLNVMYQDERLTTVTAESVLVDGGVRRADRKRYVDKLAAAVILEQWLATQSRRKEESDMADNNENMMEETDHMVQLTDENGNEINFEHLMTMEHEGSYYVVLEATEDTDDCKEGEAIILKIVRDEESGEDVYATIEDEDEFNAVFNKCVAAMEEEDEAAALDMEIAALEPDEDEE